MHKVLHFIRRRPHLSHAEFKAHFERSHAAMAIKFCGPLYLEYRHNYVDEAWFGGDARDPASDYGQQEWTWDLSVNAVNVADRTYIVDCNFLCRYEEARRVTATLQYRW